MPEFRSVGGCDQDKQGSVSSAHVLRATMRTVINTEIANGSESPVLYRLVGGGYHLNKSRDSCTSVAHGSSVLGWFANKGEIHYLEYTSFVGEP